MALELALVDTTSAVLKEFRIIVWNQKSPMANFCNYKSVRSVVNDHSHTLSHILHSLGIFGLLDVLFVGIFLAFI